MSDLLSAARAVAALADAPMASLVQLPAPEEAFADSRFGALMTTLPSAAPDERNAVLDILAPAINAADPYQGNRIAIVCGTLVERGGDPARVAPDLLKRLPGQLALAARSIPQNDEPPLDELFALDPDGVKAWESLRFLLLACMTVFCRVLPARVEARQIPGIADTLPPLAPHFAEADFLQQLLGYTDDREMVVLHVASRKGWRVALEAVNTNFHLFTLLQGRIVGDAARGLLPGEPTAPDVLAVARGNAFPTGSEHDFARFHFHTANALQADGSLSADAGAWVWGEGTPRDVPPVDGTPVLLLGPSLLGNRSWNPGFFANIHDALRSDVRLLETLTDAQVGEWLNRIAARGQNGVQ